MHDGLVKIQLSGPDGEIETVWARQLTDDQFELDNTPLYAYGLSWRDVVEARRQTPEGFLEFSGVVRKSGHRTVRLILNPPADMSPASLAVLDRLRELGCSYEGAKSRLIGVDIPPDVDLTTIRHFLISTNLVWGHADPTYDDLFPGDAV
jgi:hypothetical protein